jgi:INO80 complex subunit E
LLKVTRDRSFLLDRLIQYERTDDSSSDSEATFSSDSEAEAQKDGTSAKKKKTEAPLSMFGTSVLLSNLGYSPAASGQSAGTPGNMPQSAGQKASEPAKKRAKVSKKASQATQGQTAPKPADSHPQQQPGHMTREELERHLEMKQSNRPQFMSIDKTPNTLPDDIFNNENSNPESDMGVERVKQEPPDDTDLVIDVPQD